ncbi:MAG TPA: hypothetical protein VD995_04645 [Azospirillum sp.]|nr:hypothetical protein [Azospirillum sp.]
MAAPIISIRAGRETESGLFKGVHPLDTPLWRDGQNVLFRDGGPEKIPGWASVLTSAAAGVIRGMDALQDEAAVQRLFYGDQSKLYQWAAGVESEVGSGFTGYEDEASTHPASSWSFTRFGNWMLASNGKDVPQIWKATGSFTALGGVTFTTAEILLRRGPHILAFNTSNGASWYEWSDEDNPETWTPESTNAAGNQPIRDMDGDIKAAVLFGEQIAVLGKNQLFLVQYTGAPFYFPYRPALEGIGAVGKMAVVAANRILYGFGPNGIWQTDGVQFQYIDTLALRQYIKDTADASQLSKVAATYDAATESVLWSIPTSGTGENTVTVAYRIPTGAWSVYTFGRTCWVPQLGVFDQPFAAGTDGKIHAHNEGVDAGTAALDAWVRSKPFAAGDARTWTYIADVALQMRRAAGTVQVRLGGQKHLDDAIGWTAYKDVDDGFELINLRRSGRFITVEIRSNAVGGDFAMSGFDLYGSQGGRI